MTVVRRSIYFLRKKDKKELVYKPRLKCCVLKTVLYYQITENEEHNKFIGNIFLKTTLFEIISEEKKSVIFNEHQNDTPKN